MTDCLLFDCDGTLVDSERLCNLGLAMMFAELGVTLDADELMYRYRGWKLAKTLQELSDEHQLSLPADFVSRYRALVGELFERDLQPVPGIEAALKQLPQPKAVVSSGPLPKIQQALRVCGLEHFFGDNIYSSYDVGIWKPDPGIYRYAARDMGFAIDNCVIVEDSLVGMEAGSKSGARTFFYNKFNDPVQFDNVSSFSSMAELPQFVHSQSD